MFNVFGKSLVWDDIPDTLQQSLVGIPSGVPVLAHEVTGADNALVWRFTEDELRRVLSALHVGAEILYPGEDHDVVWSLERILAYPELPAIPTGGDVEFALMIDEKEQNTAGGTLSAGDWRIRDLNTIVHNQPWLVSLQFNHFDLSAGDYFADVICPGYRLNDNICRIWDTVNDEEVTTPQNAYFHSAAPVHSVAVASGLISIDSQTSFGVHHYPGSTQGSNGGGLAANISGVPERYTQVRIWRL